MPYLDGTLTATEIAERSGLSKRSVYAILHRNGWQGKVKPIYRRRIAPVEVNLEPHIREWVERQCPLGTRLDEMIAAIVTDAYHEENP